MKFLSNIIRGGQLSLHAMRMFQQVWNLLLYCGFALFLLLFVLGILIATEKFHWRGFYDYYLASFFHAFNLDNKSILIYHKEVPMNLYVSTIISNSYFISCKDFIISSMSSSAAFALKASGVFIVVIGTFFVYRGFHKTGSVTKRGAKLGEFSSIKKDVLRNNKKSKYESYSIAGMPYPRQSEHQHTLVVGASGVGKTVLISDLVEQIRKRGDKAIIYDVKGDYTKWFYDESKDYILNPFDSRSKEWNLLAEVSGSAKQIAHAFIAEKGEYAADSKIWDEAARIVFSEIVGKVVSGGEDLSNNQLADIFLGQDLSKIAELLEGTHAASIIDLNSSKTAASVMFVLASHFNCLKLNDGMRDESFSIRNWVLNQKQDSMLFITSKAQLSGELTPLQTAWFEIAINSILSKESGEQKTWVILDELPTLSKIPSLQKALAMSRSYGGCFMLGIQNIAQLRQKYGRDAAQDLSSECHTRCIFKTNDPDTAKWLSENVGSAEVSEFKESLSYGANTIRDGVNLNVQDKIKHVLIPSEILDLERMNLYLKISDYQTVKTSLEYKVRPNVSSGFEKKEHKISEAKIILPVDEGVEKKDGPQEENDFYKKLMEEEDEYSKD